MEPFKLFPQLVWEEMIIQNVKKPKDKLIMAQSHPQLEKLFEHEIGEWKFASIAKILFTKWAEWAEELRELDEDPMSPPHPQISEIFKAFLKCRLFSKGILKCTDAFVDENFEKSGHHLPFFPYRKSKRTKEDLRNCIETFTNSSFTKSWNPIPTRHLSLSCDEARTQDSFNMEDVLTFLQKVGHHIYSFCLHPKIQTEEQIAASPRLFRKMFTFLPNLLEFQLEETVETDEVPEEGGAGEEEPFVELPKLKHLVIVRDDAYVLLKGIDFSPCFSTLDHFNLSYTLWRDEYNKNANFPVLSSFFLWTIPIPDAKESLFGLFHHLKSPKLERILLGLEDGEHFTSRKEYNWVVSFIEEVGVLALDQQFPVDHLCTSRVYSANRRGYEGINDRIEFDVERT